VHVTNVLESRISTSLENKITSNHLSCQPWDLTRVLSINRFCLIRLLLTIFYYADETYSDDIVLLTPSARAMRKIISICDDFAINYSMQFNAIKSKCLMFGPNRLTQGGKTSTAESPVFEVEGNLTKNVDRWAHLGHVINIYLTDDDVIMSRRNCLIGTVVNIDGIADNFSVSVTVTAIVFKRSFDCGIADTFRAKI